MHLIRALGRIKPAEALMTIDTDGGQVVNPVNVVRAVADSEYWHVRSKVFVSAPNADIYSRFNARQAIEQPRPISGFYQGEVWTYNGDVNTVSSYSQNDEGVVGVVGNYTIDIDSGTGEEVAHGPADALVPSSELMRGRMVSDGVLTSSIVPEPRAQR